MGAAMVTPWSHGSVSDPDVSVGPYTATGDNIYLKVEGSATFFQMGVVTSEGTLSDPETFSFASSSDQITVRVDDTEGTGATFVLRVYQN